VIVTQLQEQASGSRLTDQDTPHLINSQATDTGALGVGGRGRERFLEASNEDQGDQSTGELTETCSTLDFGARKHGLKCLGSSYLA